MNVLNRSDFNRSQLSGKPFTSLELSSLCSAVRLHLLFCLDESALLRRGFGQPRGICFLEIEDEPHKT
jgi:hypothetical protein